MADRIITVTNPSVVTNDTLAGYNNYSNIDGQLGTTMTPTEATNGHTVTLSDGVVHEVTTKPVGAINGEFSAVVSNAVTVNLGTGIIFEDDFAGATIDTNKWAVTNPNFGSGVDIEQNNALLIETTAVDTTTGDDDITSVITSSGNAVAVFDLTIDLQGTGGYWLMAIRGVAGNAIQLIRASNNSNSAIRIDINSNSAGQVDTDEPLDLSSTKTMKIVHVGAESSISYWSGSAWVVLGTTSTAWSDNTDLKFIAIAAGASSGAKLITINNFYFVDEDISTQYPL